MDASRFDDNPQAALRRRVLDAARSCFSRYGVARTRVEDVAKAAGISRPLLYLHFEGRNGLIEALIDDEISRLVERNRARIPMDGTFAEALIEGSLAAVELGRSDELLADLFESAGMENLPQLLLQPDRPPRPMVFGLWKPVLDRARETGELRPDVSDEDVIEWLMTVHYMLLQRTDLDPDRQRHLLEQFVLPALTASPDGVISSTLRRRGRRTSS
jgi:AcrR family transcriptional regulator